MDKALKASATSARERFLEALLESATDYAIIALDLDGLVTTWNEGARRILGWTEEEMIGRPASLFFTLEDHRNAVPQAEMQAALQRGRGNDERWHRKKDGSCFWASGEMMPLRDEAGNVEGFIKILRDRTEARQAAEALREAQALNALILNASRDCIVVLDLDGNTQFISPGGIEAMEVTDMQAVLGVSWLRMWPAPDHAAAEAAVAEARAGGIGRFQGFRPTHKGTPKWWDVVISPLAGPDGRPERVVSIGRDITELKRVEQRLALSEERLNLALNASGMVGTWDWNFAAGVIHADANLARMFGLPPARTAKGAPLAEYTARIQPQDLGEVQAALDRLLAGEGEFACEFRIPQSDGPLRWIASRGRLVLDGAGQPARASGTAVDITELKQAQERQQLLMQELAHRVKNTLAVVQALASQTFRGSAALAEERQAFTARLLALAQTHDLLMQGSWTEASIRTLVDGAARLHGQGYASRFRIDGDDVTLGPKAALSFALVLHELGTNAVKYGALSTPEGHIALSWRQESIGGAPHLRFRWQEIGGPTVAPPGRQGFGTRLIERSLVQGLGAKVEFAFPPAGVSLTMEAPLAQLQRL